MHVFRRLTKALPFLVVMGVAAFLWSAASAIDAPVRPGRLGPDVWPKIILGLMLIAAAWGALQALADPSGDEGTSILIKNASRSVGREEEAQRDLEAEAGGGGGRIGLAVAGMAALLGYVAVIAYMGFAVSTFLLLLTIMVLGGYEHYLRAALISGIGALAFFFVFQKVVYVSLPMGEGPFKALTTMLMALMGVR